MILRLYRFSAPILDMHAWRQTQTASSVWLWNRDGFDFFDYRVPMFGGGHWALELPVYQALVWLVQVPAGGIEPAGRLVSIAAFVTASFLLYLVTLRLAASRVAAVAAVGIFAFLPITVFYFRAVLIDPLLVAAALAMTYAMLRLVDRFTWVWFAVLGLATVVALLGKATIVLAMGMPAVVLGVRFLLDRDRRIVHKLALATLALVSVGMAYLWTRRGDRLNLESGSLSYSDGRDYYLGSTFIDPELYRTVGARFIDNYGLPGLVLIGIGVASIVLVKSPYRLELLAMLLGGFLSLGIFANLNVIHDYYQLPYYATLSIMAGLGVATLWGALRSASPRHAAAIAGGTFIALAGLWSHNTWSTYFAADAVNYGLRDQGRELRAATPDTRLLMLDQWPRPDHPTWEGQPILWYEAKRTGWRVRHLDEATARQVLARAPDIQAIVFMRGPDGEPGYLAGLAAEEGFARTYDSGSMVVYRAPGT